MPSLPYAAPLRNLVWPHAPTGWDITPPLACEHADAAIAGANVSFLFRVDS